MLPKYRRQMTTVRSGVVISSRPYKAPEPISSLGETSKPKWEKVPLGHIVQRRKRRSARANKQTCFPGSRSLQLQSSIAESKGMSHQHATSHCFHLLRVRSKNGVVSHQTGIAYLIPSPTGIIMFGPLIRILNRNVGECCSLRWGEPGQGDLDVDTPSASYIVVCHPVRQSIDTSTSL